MPISVGGAQNVLVERDAELGILHAAVSRAVAGSGSATLLLGPAGIGKSALLEAVISDTTDAVRVLRARGGDLEGDFPFGVVRQLFEGPLRAADEHVLAGPARPAGQLLGGDPAAAPMDAATLEHAFYWLTVNLAEQQPVLLVVDDLHWTDLSSLRWLVYLARRVGDHPIALVATTRPGAGVRQDLIDRLAAEAAVLEPEPISAAGVRHYLRERLPDADDAFCSASHDASGGNPFLVTEVVATVLDSGLEPVSANTARVRTATAQNVLRSVLVRLRGLSADATPVAHALAVLGECDQVRLVARLSGLPDATAIAALDELRSAHILSPDDRLQFVHSIVQSAVYEAIPPARRSLLHASAARLLDEAGSSPDAVAGQLLRTSPGSDLWVCERLVAAATSGLAVSTPETAAAYLERALRESVTTGPARVQLLLHLGSVRYQTVAGGAVAAFEEALTLTDDPATRMQIGRALASAFMTEKRYDECWSLVEQLLAEADGRPEVVADVELFAAQALYTHLEVAPPLLSRIAAWRPDATGATARDRSMVAIQAWLAVCEAAPAQDVSAKARAALSTGTLVADDTFYVTFEMAVWGLLGAGEYEAALAALDAAIESRRAIGQLLRAATVMVLRSEALRRLGRLDDAETDARVATELLPPGQVYVPQATSSLIFVLLARGAIDEARAAFAAQGFDDSMPDGGVSDLLWLARGRLRIAEGDIVGGVDDVLYYGAICEALGRRSPAYFPWRSVAASALVQLGRRDEAVGLAGEECDLADAVGVADVRGRSLSALGAAQRGEAAVRTLTTAVELLDGSALVLDTAEARLNLGRALRLTGNRDAARLPLRQALDAATRIGALPIAEQAREELLATGARPRREALYGPDALTPSERRVAALAVQGLTNRELAHTLFVTPKTIEAHLAATYRKLGIAGKADLAQALLNAS